MTGGAEITVCIPVFEGAGFVEQTLLSLTVQSHADFRCIISVDPGCDASADICRRFEGDMRFTVSGRDKRLGWVGNCNWLLEKVDTPYFCLLFHDDLIEPDYLAILLQAAKANPDAAVVYSDIQPFGDHGELTQQPSISGSRLERTVSYLKTHYNAVAFRGLAPRQALAREGAIPGGDHDDFAQDTVWLFKLLQHGRFHRVKQPLYLKRYVAGQGVHGGWARRDLKQQMAAWLSHCADLARIALCGSLPKSQQAQILQALVFRLLRRHPALGPFEEISVLPSAQQVDYVRQFLCEIETLADKIPIADLSKFPGTDKITGERDIYQYFSEIIGNG